MNQYIDQFERDEFETREGSLTITFIGRSALIFHFQEKTIHVDPVMREADYTKLPAADLVLITHEHHDHFDVQAIETIATPETDILCPERCAGDLKKCTIINNHEAINIRGVFVESIPAYNIVHMRHGDTPFHPRGHGNGYILVFGGLSVYVAGDTENIPEMKRLENIDIAFLPMNQPVTMSPEMVEDAIRAFMPKVFYPYHYGDTAMKWGETDPNIIIERLADLKEVEVRIRKMK